MPRAPDRVFSTRRRAPRFRPCCGAQSRDSDARYFHRDFRKPAARPDERRRAVARGRNCASDSISALMSAKARAAASRCCSMVSRSRRRRGAGSPPRRGRWPKRSPRSGTRKQEVIDPARMPLTRLANAVIDAVAEATGAGRRRGGAISRLRFAVLSRRGAGRPGRAAVAALGSGAGLGARRARRPFRAGARRHACGAAGRGDRRRARKNSDGPLAAGRGVLDHHADRLRPAGAGA